MIEKEVFRDCYDLMLKYYNVQSGQAYWSELIEAAEVIERRHKSDPFVVAMLKAVLDRLVAISNSDR